MRWLIGRMVTWLYSSPAPDVAIKLIQTANQTTNIRCNTLSENETNFSLAIITQKAVLMPATVSKNSTNVSVNLVQEKILFANRISSLFVCSDRQLRWVRNQWNILVGDWVVSNLRWGWSTKLVYDMGDPLLTDSLRCFRQRCGFFSLCFCCNTQY